MSAYLELAAIWNEAPQLDPEGKFDCDTLIAQAAMDRDNVVELATRSAEGSRADIAARAAPDSSLNAAEPAQVPAPTNERDIATLSYKVGVIAVATLIVWPLAATVVLIIRWSRVHGSFSRRQGDAKFCPSLAVPELVKDLPHWGCRLYIRRITRVVICPCDLWQ